jgi:predicted O-methyltransferase YrrM
MATLQRVRAAAGALYRAAAAPFGRNLLAKNIARFPPRLVGPVEYLFTGVEPDTVRAVSLRIESRRSEIAASPQRFRSHAVDASARWPVLSPDGPITARRLAVQVSVPRRWGVLLHLCADAWAPRRVLELGACVGLSAAYLASASSRPSFVSLEGSPALAAIARETLSRVSDSSTVIEGAFEDTLERTLADLGPFDIVHIDGHHDEEATVKYVASVARHLSEGALLILDDIRLHRGMVRAWNTVCAMDGFSAAVDLGRCGLLIWAGGRGRGARFDLARYTGWWPVRRDRARPLSSPSF